MIDLWPAQTAVFDVLSLPGTYPVHDAVPQGATFPYFVIGEFTGIADEDLDEASIDASLNVHAWSRTPGKKQVLEMLEFARQRLDNVEIGSGVWACSEDFVEVMEDRASTAASRLYHGVARYRIRANQEESA